MNSQTVATLKQTVAEGHKFSMLTAYDASFASLFSSLGVEALLVGDSLGMVLQGHPSTVPVTLEDMVYHTRSVARGNHGALIIADMPFNSYATIEQCHASAGRLMQAGAQVVKLEGGAWLADSVVSLSRSGIPTCVHLGLTPQSVNKLGGYRVQGRSEDAASAMVSDAIRLVEAGADFVLLECVPTELARSITAAVDVPVIGIGAGNVTDAQVLVSYDMLGFTQHRLPRFVKNYLATPGTLSEAVTRYVEEVKSGAFPGPEHSYD